MPRYIFLLIGLLLPATAFAQVERYELGQRLRDFEKTWDQTKEVEAKRRAVAPLNQAVQSFFSFNFAAVGESLDKSRYSLRESEPPSSAVRWSESLTFRPERRFIDTNSKQLEIQIKPLYRAGDQIPKNASVQVKLCDQKPTEISIADLPQICMLPLAGIGPGDHVLTFETIVDGKRLATRLLMVSCATDLASRLGKLKNIADRLGLITTIEQATLRHLLRITADLSAGTVMETDIPAARLLREAEEVAIAISEGKPYYVPSRSGQFWLRIPAGKSLEAVRVFIPERLDQAKRVPLVFALHGAGGSENLFFDGYGDGITMKLCQERGWIMVAPRAGGPLGFGGTPNIVGILDALAKRYPIDPKRVYLIGHSMGGGQAVAIAQETPNRFAGVAVLGGGGALRRPEAVKSLPFYVGVGKDDFALGSARSLSNALKKANAERIRFREYDNVEHMMIVREAVPDVFRFWEGK